MYSKTDTNYKVENMSNRKITFVFKKYLLSKGDSYITNDLVDELRRNGVVVDVLVFGGADDDYFIRSSQGDTIAFKSRSSIRYFKYIFEWGRIWQTVRQYIKSNGSNLEMLVIVAPLTVFWPFYFQLIKRSKVSICIVFDLFPMHQTQIGSIPLILGKLLGGVEAALLRKLDLLTGMSQANVDAIVREYKVPSSKVHVLNLWCSDHLFVKEGVIEGKVCDGDQSTIRLVFGGQVTKGRSLEFAINQLDKIRGVGLDVRLTVMSSGGLYEKMKEESNHDWILFKDRLPRSEYISYLENFDFGLVVTDGSVNLPTFPSKTLEYIASGLKVVCFIEEASDIAESINSRRILHCNKFDSSPGGLRELQSFLSDEFNKSDVEEILELRARFSVKAAAFELLKIASIKSQDLSNMQK